VTWDRRRNRWSAQITVNGKHYTLYASRGNAVRAAQKLRELLACYAPYGTISRPVIRLFSDTAAMAESTTKSADKNSALPD
jgi:hypothetical protein